jgi:hypothetical protein
MVRHCRGHTAGIASAEMVTALEDSVKFADMARTYALVVYESAVFG